MLRGVGDERMSVVHRMLPSPAAALMSGLLYQASP